MRQPLKVESRQLPALSKLFEVYFKTGIPKYLIQTTGPRIPGLLLSPFVPPGSVCSATLDHTSVLQLLAEKFTPDSVYSTVWTHAKRQVFKASQSRWIRPHI